jgi:hypothetical protein
MINDSIKFLVQSIEKSPVLEKNGCNYQILQDVFPNELVQELSACDPTSVSTKKLERQLAYPRVRVDYAETISKKLNLIFKSTKITELFESKYNLKLVAQTADIWFDSKGYNLTPHTDDPRLAMSMQIYLDTNENVPGTALFESKDAATPFCQFKYERNNGYSLLNNQSGYHGTAFAMETTGIRKSVYVRYGKRTY